MGVEYLENALTAEALALLRHRAGWRRTELAQAERALENTRFTVAALDGGRTVGMGRLVGDGAMIWYIQDVVVLPEYRGSGVGSAIVRRLTEYVRREAMPGTNVTIGLMSAKGMEPFYEKLGFYPRPNEREGAGMMMRINV